MFCDKCGSPIGSGAQFCSACGKATGTASMATTPNVARTGRNGRVQRHIQLLASLWLANGILRFVEVGTILIAGQVLPFLMAWGMGGRYANWPFTFLPFGLYGIAGILAFFGVAHLLLAWALFQREPWARPLAWCLDFWRCCGRRLAPPSAFTRFGCCYPNNQRGSMTSSQAA